jgi:dUTP pyrophosphatase
MSSDRRKNLPRRAKGYKHNDEKNREPGKNPTEVIVNKKDKKRKDIARKSKEEEEDDNDMSDSKIRALAKSMEDGSYGSSPHKKTKRDKDQWFQLRGAFLELVDMQRAQIKDNVEMLKQANLRMKHISDMVSNIGTMVKHDDQKNQSDLCVDPAEPIKMRVIVSKNPEIIGAQWPTYGRTGDGGADLYAPEDVIVPAWSSTIVNTGIQLGLSPGQRVRIQPRSGLAFGEDVDSFYGLIDSNYRGDIQVLMRNFSDDEREFIAGSRIAQMVLERQVEAAVWVHVNSKDLGETERGTEGFGSSDKNPNTKHLPLSITTDEPMVSSDSEKGKETKQKESPESPSSSDEEEDDSEEESQKKSVAKKTPRKPTFDSSVLFYDCKKCGVRCEDLNNWVNHKCKTSEESTGQNPHPKKEEPVDVNDEAVKKEGVFCGLPPSVTEAYQSTSSNGS